jgi:NAD(P)-dependent dehydrogenase (short-subunit alcohol dehydrogenase family)
MTAFAIRAGMTAAASSVGMTSVALWLHFIDASYEQDHQESLPMKSIRTLAAIALMCLPLFAVADTVLITGANSGIGLEFTRQYAAKGWTVIATHRHDGVPKTLAEVMAKHKNVRAERMDVSSYDEIKALAAKLKGEPIDVLINNAGLYADPEGNRDSQVFGSLKYSLHDDFMAVNVRGALMVAETFQPNVAASKQKKIVSISSTNGSLTEQLAGDHGIWYRSSKAALNRAMQLVARNQEPKGVIVALLHPGTVRTERLRGRNDNVPGAIDTPDSVRYMIATIDKLTLKDAGRFMNYDGTDAPW